MGTLGFSYVGFIYLCMLMLPNLIWARHQPDGYSPAGENRIMLIFERIGQVTSTCCLVFFQDYNLRTADSRSIWLVLSFICMLLYEVCWIRYFRGGCTLTGFYGSFLRIPVPLATLPIAALILLGIYGQVIWLVVTTVILGIGHISIHIQHAAFAQH